MENAAVNNIHGIQAGQAAFLNAGGWPQRVYILVHMESDNSSFKVVRIYRSKERADKDCALLVEFGYGGKFEIVEKIWAD